MVSVVLYYHLRIYMRVFRALVARARKRRGVSVPADEELGSAKLALTMIDRSKRAWDTLAQTENAAVITPLVSTLNEIERGLQARRAFVRIGLDLPIV